MASNFREEVERVTPPPLLGQWGDLFFWTVFGLVADTFSEAMSVAHRAAWLRDELSPDDVLPLIGRERRMPRYLGESSDSYRARLHDAWNAYRFAGDESSILGQLTAAGFTGAEIYDGWHWNDPHWSRFWVVYPPGTHTVTAAGRFVGEGWSVGDGTIVGLVGLTVPQIQTIRGIIQKWKSVRWICGGVIFIISGWVVGAGHDVGEDDLTIGGESATIGV